MSIISLHFSSIYVKCSEYLRGFLSFIKSILRIRKKPADMGAEDVWFDGVDKKLIEMHSKKIALQEGNDETLTTKTPLTPFSNFVKKKKMLVNNIHLERKVKEGSNNQNATKESSKSSSTKSNGRISKTEVVKPNTGLTDELAIDCEMVECYYHKSVLARVSIVNLFGHPILDQYVAPPAKVTDYRTRWSGIRKQDLDDAPDFETVQKEVESIIKDRIVVGHALHNDFAVLKIQHPPDKVRDTSIYFRYLFQGKSPSLKKLCESVLGIKIQKGEHDSVQDAQATMKLYVKERDRWNDKLAKEAAGHSHQTRNFHQKTKPKKKKIKTFYVLNN